MASGDTPLETEYADESEESGSEQDFDMDIEFDESVDAQYANTASSLFPAAPQTSMGTLPPSANAINWTSYNFAQNGMVNGNLPFGPSGTSSEAPTTPAAPASATAAYMAKHELSYGGRGGHWDPTHSSDWDSRKPGDLCLGRIARDLHSLYTDPIPGVMVHASETNVTKMMALLTGPVGTPYEGGFFEFFLRFPPDYPITSPRVRFLTTGGGTVRFNPNLYNCGKVCLSLLGTWTGPAWSPALNTSSLLLSIQSLMGEFPFRNEPGFDTYADTHPQVIDYNHTIQHETLRVAVIGQVEKALAPPAAPRPNARQGAGDQEIFNVLPASFRKVILEGFLTFYDKYLAIIDKHKDLTGKKITNSFSHSSDSSRTYAWADLKVKLAGLKIRVEAEIGKMKKKAEEDAAAADSAAEEEKTEFS